MNPVKQIGRYRLPILNVVAIRERDRRGLRRLMFWVAPGFDAFLVDGHRIHFTVEEKEAYDRAIEEHDLVMQVYGMARGMGLRG